MNKFTQLIDFPRKWLSPRRLIKFAGLVFVFPVAALYDSVVGAAKGFLETCRSFRRMAWLIFTDL